ncbi:hypothetical protein [Methylocystis parvus]|uniref:PRC-barrel domain containing protein n=1 Tax=Methylocystis parvus TaxID=134 RepID=A0A6B8MBL6_9HYPH|nr:hypothetical protein [Methylocystis parvus]QGM99152.1 hypothetical protein F7D14_17780 [Methylocystis parvus]WBK00474.1 hypothetical protein MMG94_01750 [Methylocystis parvus OBBP]
MRRFLTVALFLAALAPARAEPAGESVAPKSTENSDTQEFFDARGRPIGSVTKIGGVTYFNGPDGKLVGAAEMIEGRRVYKTY